MSDAQSILEVRGLKKYFPVRKGLFRRTVGQIKAVDDVDLYIQDGETLGLVGESGCGKTTTGWCIVRLHEPTAGSIRFRSNGELKELTGLAEEDMKQHRRDMQIIFQDPFSSLDPRMSVRDIIAEPLKLQNVGAASERVERVAFMMDRVGLDPVLMNRYPHEFSGGQRQRIGIARSLVLNPRLVVCDEPVSALDVSVQAQVLNLLMELQDDLGLTYLFIAHELNVVDYISDRIAVMYLGKIVEIAEGDDLYQEPKHPYTEALLGAIPVANPRLHRTRRLLEGSVPSALNPPSGCRFHTRCPYAQDICRESEPVLKPVAGVQSRLVACHRWDELSLAGFVVPRSRPGQGR